MDFDNPAPMPRVNHLTLPGHDLFVLHPDDQPEGARPLARYVSGVPHRCIGCGSHKHRYTLTLQQGPGLAGYCIECAQRDGGAAQPLALSAPIGRHTKANAAAFLGDVAWFAANPSRRCRLRSPATEMEREFITAVRARLSQPECGQDPGSDWVVICRESGPATFTTFRQPRAAFMALYASGEVAGLALDCLGLACVGHRNLGFAVANNDIANTTWLLARLMIADPQTLAKVSEALRAYWQALDDVLARARVLEART